MLVSAQHLFNTLAGVRRRANSQTSRAIQKSGQVSKSSLHVPKLYYLHDQTRNDQLRVVEELCVWITDHLHDLIGWSTLERRSQLTHEQLEQCFQALYGLGPMQWIRIQREHLLHAAKQPVAERVLTVGEQLQQSALVVNSN
jgi:AraC-like DNA-binding protein